MSCTTPIADFTRRYAASGTARLHMPGHKGKGPLGCEHLDITEISGADSLYEADGIIAESEQNAAQLFGSQRTLYSTEGSSQCVRAMLHLCLQGSASRTVVAARNVHKSFVYAAALIGFDVVWLYPETSSPLCACPVSSESLRAVLSALPQPPACVYVTSPDYLGGQQDIAALSEICHAFGTLLAVDNAHGAYLHFQENPLHPLDLGADICCDSAHKTLGVLTGGAYLHIAKRAPKTLAENARQALALFGSTSPSYLIMASLDLANARLASSFREELAETATRCQTLCQALREHGWSVSLREPLKITLHASAHGVSGTALADTLRKGGVECEFADPDDLVLMVTPDNVSDDFRRTVSALGAAPKPVPLRRLPPAVHPQTICSIREAIFAPHETLPAEKALGRVCAAPTVSCPPAVPVVVSGERIDEASLKLFDYYGVSQVDVVR